MNLAGLTANLSIKLFALALAFVVFAHVQTEKEREDTFRVPLRMVGLSESLVLAAGSPRHAQVRLRASGKQILKLKVQPPEVLVDLRNAGPGIVQRMLSPTDVALPPGSSVEVKEIVEPRMVEIVVDTLVRATLPVHGVWGGQPATALAVAGPIVIEPAEVTVIGPARLLDSIAFLSTMPFDLGEARGDTWNDVLLDLPSGVRGVHSESVRIRVPLVPATNRILPDLLVVPVDLPPDWRVEIDPPRVEILLAGPDSLLLAIPPESVSVWIPLEGREPGVHALVPEVQLPFQPQVRVIRTRPSRVEVRLREGSAEGGRTGN